MEPKIFGTQHIIYLIVSISLTVVGLILIKKFVKTDKAKFLLVKICGGVLFLTILINRIFCEIFWQGEFLPASICGLLSFVLGFCMLFCKKDSKVFQFLICTALVAGTISCIYPDYISQGLNFTAREGFPIVHKYYTIFCPPTITSLLHHSMQVFMSIMLLMIGWCKLDIKKWDSFILGYCCFITYGVFLIKILGKSNAMLINAPILPGTIFNWFYLGLIFLALYTIFLLILDVIQHKKECVIVVSFKKFTNSLKKLFKNNSVKD